MKHTTLTLPLLLAACAHAPAQPEAPLTTYTCTGDFTTITADYYAKNPANTRVILTLLENHLTLPAISTSPATGDRYAEHNPPKPGTRIWWNKGSSAILYQITTSENGYTYEKQLATCGFNPNPFASQPLMPLNTGSTALEGTIPGTVPGAYFAPRAQ